MDGENKMKLTVQSVERAHDTVTINANFVDKWRKPAFVKIVLDPEGVDNTLLTGDIKESMDTLHCIAEIAWNNGWRPAGLAGHLQRVIEIHKIPKT